ncbi:hypothetical protein QAD02_009493 [Eretmocerus hayati]|uniref:Uncharacterized protein n=1 Tax=Eretmocerus hayati TaxID=131215 RepID=A0ACC2NDZ8_9HYME|nr:hypothetical protein QAD02_009493 [Eretmocerus hayati]
MADISTTGIDPVRRQPTPSPTKRRRELTRNSPRSSLLQQRQHGRRKSQQQKVQDDRRPSDTLRAVQASGLVNTKISMYEGRLTHVQNSSSTQKKKKVLGVPLVGMQQAGVQRRALSRSSGLTRKSSLRRRSSRSLGWVPGGASGRRSGGREGMALRATFRASKRRTLNAKDAHGEEAVSALALEPDGEK